VVTCPAVRLPVALHAARKGGAHIAFIDTAPAIESSALAAVQAANFCVIVSRPGILDLRSIDINMQIARLAGRPVALIMNAAPARDGQAAAAGQDAGASCGVEVCPIIVHQRAVFGHALAASRCAQEVEPAGKAAAEIAAVWDWIAQRTSMAASSGRLSA
jgi:chromosome partitioning protein